MRKRSATSLAVLFFSLGPGEKVTRLVDRSPGKTKNNKKTQKKVKKKRKRVAMGKRNDTENNKD